MSPKAADPNLRVALIEAAARIISEHGIDALSLRRVAGDVGTSTMAIYTHFGSMEELHQAVRHEGFARLAAYLSAVPETDDPVVDLAKMGQAYYANARTNPNLYRAMFMEDCGEREPDWVGLDTFQQLVDGVARCVDAGRLRQADPVVLALQIWAYTHGVAALELAKLVPPEVAEQTMTEGGANLLVAFGLT